MHYLVVFLIKNHQLIVMNYLKSIISHFSSMMGTDLDSETFLSHL